MQVVRPGFKLYLKGRSMVPAAGIAVNERVKAAGPVQRVDSYPWSPQPNLDALWHPAWTIRSESFTVADLWGLV